MQVGPRQAALLREVVNDPEGAKALDHWFAEKDYLLAGRATAARRDEDGADLGDRRSRISESHFDGPADVDAVPPTVVNRPYCSCSTAGA